MLQPPQECLSADQSSSICLVIEKASLGLVEADTPALSVERLLAVIDLQTAIVSARLDLDEVMRVVVERAALLTRATGSVVELVDGAEMVYRAVSGSASTALGMRLKRAASLSGLCVEMKAALCSDDTSCDPRVDKEACLRVGVASMICVPLFHEDRAVGVLKVLSTQTHAFGADDIALLKLLGNIIGASMHQATTHEKALQASLEDALTGLSNRRAFDQFLSHELLRFARYHHPLTLALFDLDGFKIANDRFGHPAGDEALRRIASLLRSSTRVIDQAFRLGGDEFAILMPSTPAIGGQTVVDRCIATVEAAHLCEGTIGMSAGMAAAETGDTEATLTARADAALYTQKRKKKAR